MMVRRRLIAIGILGTWAAALAPARAQEPGGLTLARAVEIALARSPILRAGRQQVEAAQAGVERARAGFLPRLDLHESFTRADNPVFAFSSKLNQGRFTTEDFDVRQLNDPPPVTNFQTTLALSQPLYAGGRTALGLERARLRQEAAAQGLDRRRQEVVFQVARAYYGVLLAGADVGVVEAALHAAEGNRDLARARFEAELTVESDALSAAVRLAALREEAILARNRLALAKAGLNDAMGRALDEPVEPADPLIRRPARHADLEGLEGLALRRRSDYRQLAVEARATDREIALARSEFLPTLSARASYDLNHLDLAANGQDGWFAGVVLTWNLFNGFGDRARMAEARARLEEVEALRAAMAGRVRLEVREARLGLRAAEERIEVAQKAVAQAETSLRIIRDRYQAGLTTIVDLLANEAALTRARGAVARALHDWNVGLAGLELALGTIGPDAF